MTLPQTTSQLLKITYPNGSVAYAPVFLNGFYYGKADVDAGHAYAEPTFDEAPLDRYYEWNAHTSTATLERIEETFVKLLARLPQPTVSQIIETLSTSEVYTHFRRFVGLT